MSPSPLERWLKLLGVTEVSSLLWNPGGSPGSLVLPISQLDTIIGSFALQSMQLILDYGNEKISLAVGKKNVLLPLFGEAPVNDGMQTDIEDFTSPGQFGGEHNTVKSSLESSGSDGGSYNEHELVLAILNKEPYYPHIEGRMLEKENTEKGKEVNHTGFLVLKMKYF